MRKIAKTIICLSVFSGLLFAQEFNSPVDISSGTVNGISALDAADFTDDGLLDVAVFAGGKPNGATKTYAWFEQKANGNWEKHSFGNSTGLNVFWGAAKCADIDSDGDQDVVFTADGHTSGPVKAYLLENPGKSSVNSAWPRHEIASIDAEHSNDMQIADIDNDGKLDVIIRHKEPNDIKVLFQNAKTDWTVKKVGNKNGEGLSVGDIDGDGVADISVSGYWYKAKANPRTDGFTKYTYANYSNIATKEDIGDINGDGRNDIILSPAESYDYYGTSGKHDLAWYENPGNPTSSSAWKKHVVKADINDFHFVRLADFDNDGDLDVASAKPFGTSQKLLIYYNDKLNFSRVKTVSSSKGAYSGAVKDMDSDGDIDIVGENKYGKDAKPYYYENLLKDGAVNARHASSQVTSMPYALPCIAAINLYSVDGRLLSAGNSKAQIICIRAAPGAAVQSRFFRYGNAYQPY
jgi:hypothetical protein